MSVVAQDIVLNLTHYEAIVVRNALRRLAKQRRKDAQKWTPEKGESNVSQTQLEILEDLIANINEQLPESP